MRGEREKKKQRVSEDHDLFSKSDANIKSTWRVKSHIRVTRYILKKYITLSQRPIERTLRCGSPLPTSFFRKATLMGHTLFVEVLAILKKIKNKSPTCVAAVNENVLP